MPEYKKLPEHNITTAGRINTETCQKRHHNKKYINSKSNKYAKRSKKNTVKSTF